MQHVMAQKGVTHTTSTNKEKNKNSTLDSVREALHNDKFIKVLGTIASIFSVCMYVSYFPQIMNNLAGHPGTPWQPLAAMFNCITWSAYGLLLPKKSWPIIVANVPGVFLAAITFVTALFA